VALELYGQDWVVRRGHRIGVLLSGSNSEWWAHVPTQTTVSVASSSIGLPVLARRRTRFLDGTSTPALEDHLGSGFTIERATIEANERAFRLPGP
jgi:hypothetical protein